VTYEIQNIDVEKIIISPRIRRSKKLRDDLYASIKEKGLLEPLTVLRAPNGEDYFLVHGLNRLYVLMDMGMTSVPCIVRSNIDTQDIKLYEATYNGSKKYDIYEIIDFAMYMESRQIFFIPSEIEELLGLNYGEYLKLKALIEFGDDELLRKVNKELTISQAFKRMEKLLAKKAKENGEEKNDDMQDENKLEELPEPNLQQVGKRTPLNSALRKEVEARDEFTCQSCGLKGQTFNKIFEVHHIVPVYLSGEDDLDNLVLLCPNCHKMVHLFSFNDLYITEENKERFITIIKLGNIIKQKITSLDKPIDVVKKEYEKWVSDRQ